MRRATPCRSSRKATWSHVDPGPVLRLPAPQPDRIGVDKRTLHQSPLLAIRSFDFIVEPRAIYRYRVRVIVVNPDFDKVVKKKPVSLRADADDRRLLSDVASNGRKVLDGPWSERVEEVAVSK